ncbi:hypothetical protein ACFXTN_006882 [Malus domestica]
MPNQSLASIKTSCSSNGLCHITSLAHDKPTPGPCQPTYRTTLTTAPWRHYPRRRQEEIKFLLHWCGIKKTKKATKNDSLHGQDVEDC